VCGPPELVSAYRECGPLAVDDKVGPPDPTFFLRSPGAAAAM